MTRLRRTGSGLPAPGDFLRDYEILSRIGAGGMGVVLEARDLKLHRTVALKFLPLDLYGAEADKQGLLKEARAISALDHPNICTVYGLEETDDGQLFMAMAHYDGGTLAGKIANGPIPAREAAELLRGIVSGVAAAHAHDVLHRDIKPSNILLTGQNVPKLVDFGLSRAISKDSTTRSLTISGTAAYMAPEQLRAEVIDQRVDIWAIGVTAAEMLSGRHPFRRDSLPAVAHAICNDPPEIADYVPLALQRIVYKCLSKTPELRYGSCDELLHDLTDLHLSSDGVALAADAAARPSEKVLRKTSSSQRKALSGAIAAASGTAAAASSIERWWIAACFVLLLLAGVFAFPVPREYLRGLLFGPRAKHIAVLPFDNVSGDPATAPLAAGLMDSMTAALSNLDEGKQSLWVIPAEVVRFSNVKDPVSAFKELGATLVVKGKLEHTPQRVAINLNLINGETLRQIGAITASNDNGDLAAAEADAVTQLGYLLNVSGGRDAVARSGSSNVPAAYDSYLAALSYLQRFDKPKNLDLAVDQLKKAIAQDPEFALAYAKLGEAYRLKYKNDKDTKWVKLALDNCDRALELNPQLSSAYVTLGSIHAITGKNELALTEFQKAVALDSRNPDAVIGVAWSYEQADRLPEAEAQYKRAAALNASDWSNRNELALFYDRHNRFADAIEQLKLAIASSPDNPMLYFNLGAFYLDSGIPSNLPLAEDALRKSLSLAPTNGAYGNLALLYLHERRYKEAAAAAEKAVALDNRQVMTWRYAELAYRWLGDKQKADAALGQIEKLAQARAEMNPGSAIDQSWLGLVDAQREMCWKVVPHIESAISLAPGDSQVVVNAVEAYNRCADDTNAKKLIGQALQSGVSIVDLQVDPDMQLLLAQVKAR